MVRQIHEEADGRDARAQVVLAGRQIGIGDGQAYARLLARFEGQYGLGEKCADAADIGGEKARA